MNGLNLIDDQEKFRHGMEVFLNPPDFSVGTTPSEIIFREDKMKLIHYIPTVEKPHPVPILIGVELRKLSPGAGFFDSDVRPVTRDCFLSRMEVIK